METAAFLIGLTAGIIGTICIAAVSLIRVINEIISED